MQAVAAPCARVVVCSKNPVKVNAVAEAFRRALPHLQLEFTGAASCSGVADQPWGDAETLSGALNRVSSVLGAQEEGSRLGARDLVVALEGGVGPAFSVPHPLLDSQQQHLTAVLAGQQQENVPPNRAGSGGGNAALECFAWAVVRAPSGALSRARSASFELPPAVAELVRGGLELGAADDAVFGRVGSGQGTGTIGRLTLVDSRPLVTRQAYYEHAMLMALVPLLNAELYPGFEMLGCD